MIDDNAAFRVQAELNGWNLDQTETPTEDTPHFISSVAIEDFDDLPVVRSETSKRPSWNVGGILDDAALDGIPKIKTRYYISRISSVTKILQAVENSRLSHSGYTNRSDVQFWARRLYHSLFKGRTTTFNYIVDRVPLLLNAFIYKLHGPGSPSCASILALTIIAGEDSLVSK